MAEYIDRLLDLRLPSLVRELPAIAVVGPKAVGKTSTARRLARTEFLLDDPFVREAAAADPHRLLEGPFPVLLDEWQRMPETWDLVRRWVDDGADGDSVILTGSAAPRGVPLHSGAGRIVTVRMRPLSLAERGITTPTVSLDALLNGERPPIAGDSSATLIDYVNEVTASGMPRIRRLSPRARAAQLDAYLEAVVQREFPSQGIVVRSPEALRAWLRSYAAVTATTASYTVILDGATGDESEKPAKSTTLAYRDVLTSLWLLDPVEAWSPVGGQLGRLARAPKHFLADPAFAARLLDIDADDLAQGVADRTAGTEKIANRYGTLLGRLFEALVALSLHTYTEHVDAALRHVRTRNGDHEVDFVVVRKGRVVAVEVKLAGTVDDADVRHLTWLRERMGDRLADAIVVTTGPTAYRRRDGIAVVPAALLGP